MNIHIRNYRGCTSLDGTAAPVLLIAGPNGAGKSSAIEAIRAALVGDPRLRPGLAKKDAARVVKRGAKAGSVTVSDGAGNTVTIEWPDCEVKMSGADAPSASRFASGAESLVEIKTKDRPAALGDFIAVKPTDDDLRGALADIKIGEKHIDRVLGEIKGSSIDGVHLTYANHATRTKGAWEQITREKWGASKADGWKPEGWTGDLDQISVDDLEAEASRASKARDAALGNAGATKAEYERVKKIAEREVPDLEALAAAVAGTKANLSEAEERRQSLPPADEDAARLPTAICPACGVVLEVETRHGQRVPTLREHVEEAEATPPDETKRRRLAISEADGRVGQLQGALAAAEKKLADATLAAGAIAEAKAELAGMTAGGDDAGAAALGAADAALSLARDRLAMKRAKEEADRLFSSWRARDAVARVLAPDGVRKAVLLRGLAGFQAQIDEVAALAGWEPARIGDDFEIRMGDDLFEDHSRSRQWRIRLMLQVAVARIDGSSAVVVDELDLLDVPSRPAAMRLLLKSGLPAVVAMTTTPEKAIDLGAKGLGQTVIIEAGEGHALEVARQEAA